MGSVEELYDLYRGKFPPDETIYLDLNPEDEASAREVRLFDLLKPSCEHLQIKVTSEGDLETTRAFVGRAVSTLPVNNVTYDLRYPGVTLDHVNGLSTHAPLNTLTLRADADPTFAKGVVPDPDPGAVPDTQQARDVASSKFDTALATYLDSLASRDQSHPRVLLTMTRRDGTQIAKLTNKLLMKGFKISNRGASRASMQKGHVDISMGYAEESMFIDVMISSRAGGSSGQKRGL